MFKKTGSAFFVDKIGLMIIVIKIPQKCVLEMSLAVTQLLFKYIFLKPMQCN